MININFGSIRPIHGSQDEAFEELVCQLARADKPTKAATFIRKGKPDAGVECIWKLNDNTEWGWQAKYFLNSLSTSQWTQIDNSVKKALEKHPKLTKYFISVPIDPSDARIEGKESMLEKWNKKVVGWKKLAASKKMKVDFIFWGHSELLEMLSRKEQEGRLYFWFNKAEFTDDWIKDNIRKSTSILAHRRYTPKINFELPIARIFDGLTRCERFEEQLKDAYKKVIEAYKKLDSHLFKPGIKTESKKIITLFHNLKKEFNSLRFEGVAKVDVTKLTTTIDEFIKLLKSLLRKLYGLQNKIVEKKTENYKHTQPYNNEIHYLQNFSHSLSEFKEFFDTITFHLVNSPFLIVEGKAGMGKSHLVADIVNQRLSNGHKSIFLLGQHFVTEENPWSQILHKQFLLQITEEVFLGSLNAKAESEGKRIIFFIDALNEGCGRFFWPEALKNFVDSIRKYEWLGLVVSIRSSYSKLIAAKEIIDEEEMPRLIHRGFEDLEHEAVKHFFKIYSIELPSVPLLQPEFHNPLFLKLVCEGLNNKGLTKLPHGFWGISQLFTFFIDSINEKLSKPTQLDYSSAVNPVLLTIKSLLEWKVEHQNRYIPHSEAFVLTQNIFRNYTNKGNNYLDILVSEGLFSEDLFWDKANSDYMQGIYLAYERFEDHLLAASLIDKYVDKENPEDAFSSGYLHEITATDHACNINRGLIEALSIQLPEKIEKELYEVKPACKNYYAVADSFVDSIIWRKEDTFSDKLFDYINSTVLKFNGTRDKFLDTLIAVSIRPDHFFNAEFLHRNLLDKSLANRDAWWTIYIHNMYDYETSVKRLIDWSWSDADKSYISDETIRLACITLGWFHTSCNRYLRDAATKGMINLLQKRTHLIRGILQIFEKVNDPYVYERLFAIAYGAIVHGDDELNLKELAEYIYQTIFSARKVYPHILLRDYARGVIEYALHKKIKLDVDIVKARPPYKSTTPKKLPTNSYIDKKYEIDYKSKLYKEYHRGQNYILSSMTTEYGRKNRMYGDFGRYVFQSALRNFKVNTDLWSNWAVERVFKLGYDAKKHGSFDANQGHGRGNGHKERIGKKYQWISFHEALAIISDNYPLYDQSSFRNPTKIDYQGPWYPYVRDIDPTVLITKTKEIKYKSWKHPKWFRAQYDSWNNSYVEWMKKTSDLPDPKKIIENKYEANDDWLLLEGHPEWDEPITDISEDYSPPHRRIWYQVRSYLVANPDKEKLLNELKKKNIYGRWMPEPGNRYEVFSREYFWSHAYKFFQSPFYSGETQSVIFDNMSDKIIGNVNNTTSYHLWEEEFDCSKEHVISFIKPSDYVYSGLKLKQSEKEGEFINTSGELVCLDPCTREEVFSCLLVKKKAFLKFLKENNLSIFWTVIGEKQVLGNVKKIEKYEYKEISGLYELDKQNNVLGSLKFYSVR